VTSSVEGLGHLFPSIPVEFVVVVIILALFLIQPLGTARLGKSFGKVMFVWFLMLGALGILSFFQYPAIIKAFNPYYAIKVLIDVPDAFSCNGNNAELHVAKMLFECCTIF
jgi:KUP system potassium uptake protein